MKLLQYIAAVSFSLLAFTSCESDIEKTIYDINNVTPAVLTGLADSYVLDQNKGAETALSLEWSKPDMTYQASVTNLLQMDLNDKNFTKPVILSASQNETSFSTKTSDFNKQIISLLSSYEMEYTEGETIELAFRIGSYISTATDTVYSDISTTVVTPYAGEAVYPSVVVVGSYCGWGFETCQFLYSANSDDNYSGMIYFNGKSSEGWKITKGLGWDTGEWGAKGDITPEASETTLVTSGGGNISAYSKKNYWVELNSTTGLLKMSQGYNSWGIVGGYNGWGATPDTEMSYGNDSRGAFLIAEVNFPADNLTWKIRPESKWENDRGPGNTSYEGDVEDNGDGNFKVNNGAGTYEIKWYFNKVSQVLCVTKK